MRKVLVAAACAALLLFFATLTWKAEATTLSGAATARPLVSYALVEKAGLIFNRLCPGGMHRLCKGNLCACSPSSGHMVNALNCKPGQSICIRACWEKPNDPKDNTIGTCKYCC
jgi:hypothetical protein